MWPYIGLCSTRTISRTDEDGWEDSAKVPSAVPAPREDRHKPKDAGLMRVAPAQPKRRLEQSFLGFQRDNDTFLHRNKEAWQPKYV